jgi:protein-S-isoprenylcysteine O-methyltransferase Ste14
MENTTTKEARGTRGGFPVRRMILLVGGVMAYGAVLFLISGRLDWWQAWAYLGIWLTTLASMMIIMQTRHPDLIEARTRRHANTKKCDRIILAFYSPLPLILVLVAGLDRRFGWSEMPLAWSVGGLALLVLGILPSSWALAVNPHFEATVRIQEDRDHKVISTGPYRYVRHPGYLSVILTSVAAAFLLGSYWALVPAAAITALLSLRTALEDRVLQRELPGYEEYASRVRFRLLPGLW